MQVEFKGKDLPTLLALYNQEIDVLKSKLLNGVPWDELEPQRRNVTELAIAIHKSHNYIVAENVMNSHPAASPHSSLSGEPAE